MQTAEPIHVFGHCYCGAVNFEVRMPAGAVPFVSAYCHCDSCRRAHAAALYHVIWVDEDWFRVTSGAEHLKDYCKPGGVVHRTFCSQCGSKVLNRCPTWQPDGRTPVGFFPSLLDEDTQRALPAPLRANTNHLPEERVLEAELLRPLIDG